MLKSLDAENFINECESLFDTVDEDDLTIEKWEKKARGNIEYIKNTNPRDLAEMLFAWKLRPKQLEIFTYVVERFLNLKEEEVLQVQIIGAYGVGKTSLEAMLILTIMYLYDLIKSRDVVEGFQARLLSGSEKQVDTVMWRELKLILMVANIGNKFKVESTKLLYLPYSPIILDKFVWNSTNEQSQTGAHGGLVSIFFDEGTAISDLAYAAVSNYFSGRGQKGIFIVTGNANRTDCEFERISEEADWKTFRWTRYCDLQPGEVDAYAERVKRKYGEDSDEWRMSVMAQFPLTQSNALIPRAILNLAVERVFNPNVAPIYMGIDIAKGVEGGDCSAICVRNNQGIIYWWCGNVSIEMLKMKFAELFSLSRPRVVIVDEVGVGYGFADWLRIHFHSHETEIIMFNAGTKPDYNIAAKDKRTEVAMLAAEWITNVGHVPYDKEFFEECSWLKIQKTESGKLKLITKNEMKRSTDRFDAFSYTFAKKYSDMGIQIPIKRPIILSRPQVFNPRNSF